MGLLSFRGSGLLLDDWIVFFVSRVWFCGFVAVDVSLIGRNWRAQLMMYSFI